MEIYSHNYTTKYYGKMIKNEFSSMQETSTKISIEGQEDS